MTLGDGILWSTVLILLAAGIYQVSIRKKWKLIGKMIGVLILVGAMIGGGIWGWMKYQDRPKMTTSLGGIGLDLRPVEVSLKLGEPIRKIDVIEVDEPKPGSEYSALWVYAEDYEADEWMLVRFYGSDPDNITTGIICQFNGSDELVGVNRFYSEDRIIERLGEPTHVSINKDGTSKYISYEHWLAAFEIERGRISALCLSKSGRVTFGVEYGEEDEITEP